MKDKKCAVRSCGRSFLAQRMGQKVCSPVCALEIARAKREQAETKKRQEERRKDRETRDRLKTRGEWVSEAQQAINRFRRIEEHALGRTCISCQRPRHVIEGTDGWKPGGAWDAGHFMSVGARPELRFEPRNIWLQCKSCNGGSGKYAKKGRTVAASYEANLRAQEGDELVDWLKGPHEMPHHTIDDLKRIRDHYRAKANQLAKQLEKETECEQ